MLGRIDRWVRRLNRLSFSVDERLDLIHQALGRIEARQTAALAPGDITAAEFKVSSQWGEDGIIEHLVRHIPIARDIFVEFGVQDYRESNTRFLLTNRNWSGLVIDGSSENIALIKRDQLYWRYNLKAAQAFLTRDNINDVIAGQGVSGDIGLLSIDIDGNDYWVWQAISCVAARIVVVEYNAMFGPNAAVSTPYDATFTRHSAHYSGLYWGCSLAALAHLADLKGYALVGTNSAGNNAFFVRRDVLGLLPALSSQQAFRAANFRDSRGEDGSLSHLGVEEGVQLVGALELVDVVNGSRTTVGQAAGQ